MSKKSKYDSMWWWRWQMLKEYLDLGIFIGIAIPLLLLIYGGVYGQVFVALVALMAKPILFWLIISQRREKRNGQKQ